MPAVPLNGFGMSVFELQTNEEPGGVVRRWICGDEESAFWVYPDEHCRIQPKRIDPKLMERMLFRLASILYLEASFI
jgi:hypothetical protein